MANFFTDRSVEFPGRCRLSPTSDTDVYDLSREEGNIYNAGTPLNAQNLNDAMQTVEDLIPTNISELTNDSNFVDQSTVSSLLTTTRKGASGTVNAGAYGSFNITETKPGYIPLGVVGYGMSGSYGGYCAMIKCDPTFSGSTITVAVGVLNTSGSTATPTVTVTILWQKIL